MNVHRILVAIILLISACKDVSGRTHRGIHILDQYIQEKMDNDTIPGLAMAMVHGDSMVMSKGYGWADIEMGIAMSGSTVVPIASVTKPIIAAAVLQLCEKKKIDLDDAINAYLPFAVLNPRFPDKKITIKQILTHTSSIGNGPCLWRLYHCGDPDVTLEEWAQGYFMDDGQFYDPGNFFEFSPGNGHGYSNAGYGLLAYLVEIISGLSLEDYCNTEIFDPLGMSETTFHLKNVDSARLSGLYAFESEWDLEGDLIERHGISTSIGELDVLCPYSSPVLGAGGLYTSVNQLSRFMIALMNNDNVEDTRILTTGSATMMNTPLVERDSMSGWFHDFGLGLYSVSLDNGESVWGHSGADPGISSFMFFNVDIKLGVIAVTNSYVDIRNIIQWAFAEGYREFCSEYSSSSLPGWDRYVMESDTTLRTNRTVRVSVLCTDIPDDQRLYIAGNHRFLGNWSPREIVLQYMGDGTWSRDFTFLNGSVIEYKITRGSWDTEALDVEGNIPSNHVLNVNSDTTLSHTITQWKDFYSESED